MSLFRGSEEQQLSACAAAARNDLRADARALLDRGDRALVELGATRHPVTACALAATAGALLGKLGARHAGPALRRGGGAAVRALRWSSLLA
ncbi:MAG: hypothetical protein DHS20C15_26290 [Planctomycetota bacterium]|nr:MAG: hypothetical protein DHS20C15_26290 [Planctomycetota bacterium]